MKCESLKPQDNHSWTYVFQLAHLLWMQNAYVDNTPRQLYSVQYSLIHLIVKAQVILAFPGDIPVPSRYYYNL